ncbi:unnamed protein product [Malus baccata var. baccata]
MSKARVKDTISGLPDPVLCHMFSFLPTKCAMRCSILSARWKNIWDFVPNLDFKNKDKSDSVAFMNFKFRLYCSCAGDYTRIDRWIRTAIRRKAIELDLGVSNTGKTLELPKSVFMCKTLVVLKVKSNVITYNPRTSRCFPSFKFLHITAEGLYCDLVENLLSCCPVIEDLIIDITLSVRGCNFKISASELKGLIITFHHLLIQLGGEKVFINAPKLENFDVKEDILANYCLENVKSLVKANVDLCCCCVHRDENFELKLVLYDCYNWDLLMKLLDKSPNLEHLVLRHKEDKNCVQHYSFQQYSNFKRNPPSKLRWHIPKYVPACLTSHLKTITIKGFKGYPHEKKVARPIFSSQSNSLKPDYLVLIAKLARKCILVQFWAEMDCIHAIYMCRTTYPHMFYNHTRIRSTPSPIQKYIFCRRGEKTKPGHDFHWRMRSVPQAYLHHLEFLEIHSNFIPQVLNFEFNLHSYYDT